MLVRIRPSRPQKAPVRCAGQRLRRCREGEQPGDRDPAGAGFALAHAGGEAVDEALLPGVDLPAHRSDTGKEDDVGAPRGALSYRRGRRRRAPLLALPGPGGPSPPTRRGSRRGHQQREQQRHQHDRQHRAGDVENSLTAAPPRTLRLTGAGPQQRPGAATWPTRSIWSNRSRRSTPGGAGSASRSPAPPRGRRCGRRRGRPASRPRRGERRPRVSPTRVRSATITVTNTQACSRRSSTGPSRAAGRGS